MRLYYMIFNEHRVLSFVLLTGGYLTIAFTIWFIFFGAGEPSPQSSPDSLLTLTNVEPALEETLRGLTDRLDAVELNVGQIKQQNVPPRTSESLARLASDVQRVEQGVDQLFSALRLDSLDVITVIRLRDEVDVMNRNLEEFKLSIASDFRLIAESATRQRESLEQRISDVDGKINLIVTLVFALPAGFAALVVLWQFVSTRRSQVRVE